MAMLASALVIVPTIAAVGRMTLAWAISSD